MKKLLLGLLCAASLFVRGERKVYAHYMGCWPAVNCQREDQHLCDSGLKKFLHGKDANYEAHVGGRIVNKPLLPYECKMTEKENLKLEIRRAIRAGFDGFAVDAWAGDRSPEIMDLLFEAAEEMKVDFGITICFDKTCHGAKWIEGEQMWERFVCSARRVLDKHKDSPNMARFNGKPLFFGYMSPMIVNFNNRESSAELRARMKAAWQKWRKALPCEVYLHGCIGQLVDTRNMERNDWSSIAKDCAETFDTVGAFLGTEGKWGTMSPLWEHAKAAGCGWSQPLFWQYSNKRHYIITDTGLEHLHRNWRLAIERGSDLLQFVTWNDYGEETIIAPSYGIGYTVMRVNKWYADLWKTGKAPQVKKDEVHVIYRRTVGTAYSFPFLARRVNVPQTLEVVTFLTAAGTVQVKNYGEYKAPSGMYVKRFELKPGKIAARVRRNGETVCGVIAPEEVSTKRWREDMTEVAYGSTYEEEWAKDFPGVSPLRYTEMADDDGDGLPNWFEMVYFGTFPDMRTATIADPNADPDSDGFTNLQEYQNDTNPLTADTPYAADYEWNLTDLRRQHPYFGNPARDTKGQHVWRFTYRFGAANEPYTPCAGAPFTEIISAGGSIYSGTFHTYLYNPMQPNNKFTSGFDTGWRFRDPTNGVAEVRVNRDTPIAVEWTAPISGKFALEVLTQRAAKTHHFKVYAEHSGRLLGTAEISDAAEGKLSIAPFTAKRGETLRIVFTTTTPGGGPLLNINNIKIKRL